MQSGEDEVVGGVWLCLCHFSPCPFFFLLFLELSISHLQLCPLHLWIPHILLLPAFFQSLDFAWFSQALDAEQLGCFYQGQQEVGLDRCLSWLMVTVGGRADH